MTGKRNCEEAGRKHRRGLAAVLLAGLLAGCATAATPGSENFLTIFVDNFEGQAVVVSIGPDIRCQVDARETRHACRFAWAGTGDLNLEISNTAQGTSHIAQAEQVSSGDRMCLQVRNTGVQLRSC